MMAAPIGHGARIFRGPGFSRARVLTLLYPYGILYVLSKDDAKGDAMEDYRSPHEQELLDAIKAIEDCDEQREFARTLLEIRRLPCAVLLDHTLYKLGELEV